MLLLNGVLLLQQFQTGDVVKEACKGTRAWKGTGCETGCGHEDVIGCVKRRRQWAVAWEKALMEHDGDDSEDDSSSQSGRWRGRLAGGDDDFSDSSEDSSSQPFVFSTFSFSSSHRPLVVICVESVVVIARAYLYMVGQERTLRCCSGLVENLVTVYLAGNADADLVFLSNTGLTFGAARNFDMIIPITSWTGERVASSFETRFSEQARFCHEIFRHLNKAQLCFLLNLVTPAPLL